MNNTTTALDTYRDLVMRHAELRALRIRINLTGVMSEAEVASLADGVVTGAMAHAEAAAKYTPSELGFLTRSVRFALDELTAGPAVSHADAMENGRRAAEMLRRMIENDDDN